MTREKKNVAEFNQDVQRNDGYLYTTNQSLSSTLANQRISDAVAKYIHPDDATLVDIGCGDGAYTSEIKTRFPRLAIEGFDPAEEAVRIARKNYPDITFRVMSILGEDAGANTARFDVAILRGVLHHLPNQLLAIRNALRMCKKLIIVEPNGNNPLLKVIEAVSPYHRKHEEQSFSYWKLRRWSIASGGEVLAHEYIGFVPFFFPAGPARVIHSLQPMLEQVPVIREFGSAQIVLVCKGSAHA